MTKSNHGTTRTSSLQIPSYWTPEQAFGKRCSAPTFWMAPASTMMPAHEQTSF
jgi:hypothetical protein